MLASEPLAPVTFRDSVEGICLLPGHATTLPVQRAVVLQIHAGRAWVTVGLADGGTPEAAGDWFLGKGDVLTVPRGARVVVQAVPEQGVPTAVHASWRDAPCAAGRFAREVAQPAGDLVAALRQAGKASLRVARGLMACGGWRVARRMDVVPCPHSVVL
jgi:hypothetical protein